MIAALAATTAFVIRHVARGSAARLNGAGDLEGRTQAIDLLAFRNLMDPAQEEFLRGSVSAREYRHLKRLRDGVAVSYVTAVFHNAAILIRLGEALQREPATAEEGARIVQLALKNRISAAFLLAKLAAGWLYPAGDFSTDILASDYSQLTESIGRILRRTMPLRCSQILADL
jgi:hypothetical protein